MLNFFEASLGILYMADQAETAEQMRATREWVRTSCEADDLPQRLTRLVVANFEHLLLSDNSFLLLRGESQ